MNEIDVSKCQFYCVKYCSLDEVYADCLGFKEEIEKNKRSN